jgi:hypothetical protein
MEDACCRLPKHHSLDHILLKSKNPWFQFHNPVEENRWELGATEEFN